MAELEGQQLGNYRLIRLLGQGGFADVYQGEHIHLNTQAAIKVLRTKVTAENAAQFSHEARIIAHLDHPNIVRVLEFGIENGMPFLVMDYAINGTLRQRHPKGAPIPLALVVPYVQQAASALQYAHSQKIIHRDLKPENMLLGKRGEILLSDFGLALTTQSSRYDSTQDIVGTVAYMAPEQLQGKPGTSSDQYALGIVAYEWLCGERPFHGSFMEIYSQHMTMPPPSLRAKLPELPADVEQAIFLTLAKNPAERFQSVQAFANALTNASQAMDRASGDATVRNIQAPTPTPAPASRPVQTPFVQSPTPPPTSQSAQTSLAIDGLPTWQMSGQGRTLASGGIVTPQPGFVTNQPGMVTPQQTFIQPQQQWPMPPLVSNPNQFSDSGNVGHISGEAPNKPKRGGKLIALIAAILLIVLFGALAIPRLQASLLGSAVHPTATSTTDVTTGTTPVIQATQGVTPDATATATATATDSASTVTPTTSDAPAVGLTTASPALPLTIACVQCGYPDLALVLTSITANAGNSTTLWTFTVTNKGASQCSSISFDNFSLEGPDGAPYQSSGQAGDNWSLNAGTATNVSPTLALIPRSGTIYTLNIQLSGSCVNYSGNRYQTENLLFAPGALTGLKPVTPSLMSPKSPTFPLTLACVQCGYPQLSLVLTTITVSASNSATVWSFTIANNGPSACSGITFAQFQLEDPNGTQYQSSGQSNDNWFLNAGSSVEESPTLSFEPQPNTTYTLNIKLRGSCMNYSDNTYQTENLQF
ncbi:MAG: protein kinase [Ktedonobacteraceae bacterium]